jgi:predicted pyridoxine 5'-phosphate oxidase superfamily flavin-nucleotide-binding protein
MVNVQQEWNLMKTQVFQGRTPISDRLWNDEDNNGANDRDSTTNIATGREAVGALQGVSAEREEHLPNSIFQTNMTQTD